MKKIYLSLFLLTCIITVSIAAPKKKAVQKQLSWIEQILQEKEKISLLKTKDLPYQSKVLRGGMAAEKVSVDLTGLQELALITWGTPDGVDYDHSVWAEGKLTDKNGNVFWLDEIQYKYKRIEGNWFTVNKNFSGKPFKIGEKTYSRGIIAHANSLIVLALDGNYVRFDAEIGIDRGSSIGTAVFKVLPTSGRDQAAVLQEKLPELKQTFLPFIGTSLEEWLTTPDNILETAAIERMITRLKNPNSAKTALQNIAQQTDKVKQIQEYMALSDKVKEVLNIQNQLAWLNTEALDLAVQDMKNYSGYNFNQYKESYDSLLILTKKGFDGVYAFDKESMLNAQKALQIKRRILLANPLLDFDKIIVTRYKLGNSARSAMAPSLGTHSNNWSGQYSASRIGRDAEIVELSNLRGNQINQRVIFKPTVKGGAVVTDVMLHWDADKMLFTSVDTTRRLQVFQVGVDGKNFEQITKINEPDLEFCDATYLPNGKYIVNSNLGYHGVPCVDGEDPVGNMVLYDPKTGDMRRITFDQDNNWNPTVLENGKVMYTRWEYTDLMHYYSRIVFHMNPDGTEQKALYGSGGYFPNSTFDQQQLPGSDAFIAIISGHHGIARSGRLMIFDPNKGRKEEKGAVQEIPYRNRPIIPIVKDEMVNGVWPQFIKPHPVNDKYFFVTAKLDPDALWGIYLVDVFDNVTLIAEYEGEGLINPVPLRKRPTPPVIPDRTIAGSKEANVFIQDIYEGEGLPKVPRGTVKKLRVMAYEYAYVKSPSNHYAQGIQAGWDIKRLLGEVPVEADGSATFTIPANTPISLQPLDSLGRAVQWMRSWFVGMPGENVSCVGCHEDQNKIAMPKLVAASRKKPEKITPPEGGVRPFTFELEIQPILDRACVSCHNDNSKLNLTGGRMDEKVGFSKSYLAFHPYFYRQGSEAEMYVLNPYEYHESASEMMQMLHAGHHGVKLTEKEWKALYNWVDFNTPYHSSFVQKDYRATQCTTAVNQFERRKELLKKYANIDDDWKKEIDNYMAYLEKQPKAVAVKPEPAKKPQKEVKVKGFPFTAEVAASKIKGDSRKTIDLGNGVKMNFVRIPAGEYVTQMMEKNPRQPVKVKIDKPFWMGEMEVSNEQMRMLLPDHNSRYVGQFWKDHTTPGYDVNQPEKSAIRMSWEEAMKFCELLSKQTGLKVTLPTAQQWEWAARAGSSSDFWFGNVNADFSPYENLADVQLTKMAVSGIDPQPMSKESFWYPYANYIPKDETIDDSNMLVTKGGTYKPNPWGLYDINGNVAEWTRTEFLPNAEKGTIKEKVVKGGAWYDRPKVAANQNFRTFLPWQKVWYVGFRVIIED